MKVILLAAGRGRRFGRRTAALPKCLIPLGRGQNLLSRYLDTFRKLKLRDIVLVVGHEKEKIIAECIEKGRGLSIKFLVNPDYHLGSIVSLFTAAGEMNDDCLIMDADVFFEISALKKLLSTRGSSFLIDPKSRSAGEEMMVMGRHGRPSQISKKISKDLEMLGEATGFLKLKRTDAVLLSKILNRLVRNGSTDVEYENSYNELMKKRKLGIKKITSFWTEMDFEADLKRIRRRIDA